MKLSLNDEQALIAKTALAFVRKRSPVSRFRALRDNADLLGYSPAIYREMAELGWTGIPFADELGGSGLGLTELALVVEALGRTLAPEPFVGCIGLAGSALALTQDGPLKQFWLSCIIDGTGIVALAHQEHGVRFDLFKIDTRAELTHNGYVLNGEKTQVLDAVGADALIIPARTKKPTAGTNPRDDITLFLLEATAPGLRIDRQTRMDHRNAALVHLDNVTCPASNVVGAVDDGGWLLEGAVDRATVILCAEMLGGMSEAFDLTLEYLKHREQFGVPIGSFQALKHRAARVFMEIELARSTVMTASRAIDANEAEAARLVSLAKARCSDAYVLTTNEAVQIFAGMGMTDECDIGFYMKRARACELTFGDAVFHRDHWAALSGY